jgi:hypothetical protein
VVAIPEGLPLAVTLTLAFSMKRMVKEHALVCTLSACETMGSVTAICTDKTGTLTLNQMKVTEFWVGTDRPKAAATVAAAVVSFLRQGAGLNTTRSVYKPNNVSPPEISGNPTEKALLSWAVAELGMDADALKRSCKVLHVEAFNSDKKRSCVMIRDNATGTLTAHWKGAAEMVLASCSAYVGSDGAARELDAGKRRKLQEIISGMAAASLRCIAFAYKHVDSEHSKIDDEGLTLLGFVGLKDPCRPEVTHLHGQERSGRISSAWAWAAPVGSGPPLDPPLVEHLDPRLPASRPLGYVHRIWIPRERVARWWRRCWGRGGGGKGRRGGGESSRRWWRVIPHRERRERTEVGQLRTGRPTHGVNVGAARVGDVGRQRLQSDKREEGRWAARWAAGPHVQLLGYTNDRT